MIGEESRERLLGKEVEVFTNQFIGRGTLIIGSKDTGSGEALGPIIKALENDYTIVVYADRLAARVLGKSQYSLEALNNAPEYTQAVGYFNPELVLTGVSQSGPGIERSLTRQARAGGTPSIWISDGLFGTKPSHLFYPHGLDVYPDYVCLPYNVSQRFFEETVPKFNRERIYVTGNPAFDELFLLAQRKSEIRERVRRELGIDSLTKLMVFASQADACDIDILADVVDTLINIPEDIALTLRLHPADRRKIDEFKPLLDRFKQAGKGKLVDSDMVGEINELVVASDLVASKFSTVNLKGIYFRKLVLYLLESEEARRVLRYDQKIEPDELPMIQLGDAIGVLDIDQLRPAVELLFNTNSLQGIIKAQETDYPLDGKNTERVVSVIETARRQRDQK